MSDEPNELPGRGVRDEFVAWRGLLRQPDALSEQGLTDKEAAWDRLFERLSKRPRRLFLSYRVAAACLLILLIPAARFFQDNPAPGPGRAPATPVVPLAIAPASRPLSNPRSPAVAPARRSRNNLRNPAQAPVLVHPEPFTVAAADSAPPMLAETSSPILLPPQKPKKQWKVIDLNELDLPPQRQHTMATSRNTRPPGLTIDLSPENR